MVHTAPDELKHAIRSAWIRFKEQLDTERGRVTLGVVLSIVLTVRYRELCRARWEGEHWVYRWTNGISFHDDPHIHRVRLFETGVLDFWDYLPESGDIALILGAGLGHEVSTLARLVGPTGRVYAFEANPRTAARLVRLCQLNKWTNVEVIQAAVTNQRGHVTISNDVDYSGNDIFREDGSVVDSISLDCFARERGLHHIDFLTMNIEGAERLAVEGMTDLAPAIDHICVSCHDFLGVEEKATKSHVKATLRAQGFSVRERPDHPHPVVRNVVYASRQRQRQGVAGTGAKVH